MGNEIFQARTRGIGVIPRRRRPAATACPAPTSAPSGVDWDLRRDKPVGLACERGRLEGLDPPRRRLASPATGCASRRSARRRKIVDQLLDGLPAGPIMAKVPRIIKVPAGEAYVADREPARRDGLLRRHQGRPRPVPGEDPHGQLQQHLDRAVGAAGRLRPRRHHDPRLASTSSSETSTGDAPARRRARRTGSSRSCESLGVLAAVLLPGRHVRLPLPVQDDVASCRAGSAPWRPARTARCSCSPRSASSSRRRTSSPTRADRRVFKLAPYRRAGRTVLLVYVVVPFGPDACFADLDTGIFYVLAVSSISVIGMLIAGWASANKYSLSAASAPPASSSPTSCRWCSPSSAWSSRPAP